MRAPGTIWAMTDRTCGRSRVRPSSMSTRSTYGNVPCRARTSEGSYVIELEEFKEFSPCQDGGIAAWLFEHGDSGCGDAYWPKSILYVAGWGIGSPP